MTAQPRERGGVLELLFQRGTVAGADVDGPAGVVLAVAGGCVHRQDTGYLLPRLQFAAKDLALVVDAAIRRDQEDLHTIARSRVLHGAPGRKGLRRQALGPAVEIGLGIHQLRWFGAQRQTGVRRITPRDSEFVVQVLDTLGKIGIRAVLFSHAQAVSLKCLTGRSGELPPDFKAPGLQGAPQRTVSASHSCPGQSNWPD